MIGIYRVINTLTDDCYVGQSLNIEQRFKDHIYCNKTKDSRLAKAVQYFGRENFICEVLEECPREELNEKEQLYIKLCDSIEDGYNTDKGGGVYNSPKILSDDEVWDIREAYKNHEDKWSTYEKFSGRITKSYFSELWEGVARGYIHMDVFTPENKQYYSKERTNGERSPKATFTNEEVLNCRQRYMNETAAQIYKDFSDRCSFQTFQEMLWGRRYKEVPVFHKVKRNNIS